MQGCENGHYGVRINGKVSCHPCNQLAKCPAGLGLSVTCGDIIPEHAHVHCEPCVFGANFSAAYDRLPCQRCASLSCQTNEYVIGVCNVDKDTSRCSGTCKNGFYSTNSDDLNCQPCSFCHNNRSARIVKCKKDGLPLDKQCEVNFPIQVDPSKV